MSRHTDTTQVFFRQAIRRKLFPDPIRFYTMAFTMFDLAMLALAFVLYTTPVNPNYPLNTPPSTAPVGPVAAVVLPQTTRATQTAYQPPAHSWTPKPVRTRSTPAYRPPVSPTPTLVLSSATRSARPTPTQTATDTATATVASSPSKS